MRFQVGKTRTGSRSFVGRFGLRPRFTWSQLFRSLGYSNSKTLRGRFRDFLGFLGPLASINHVNESMQKQRGKGCATCLPVISDHVVNSFLMESL